MHIMIINNSNGVILMCHMFKKITPFNGFDSDNPDNAKQNNYAWSMAEMGDFLYVGTGRNIFYTVLKSGFFGDIPVPPVFLPQVLDMNAEIWRFKKEGTQGWERVYKAPPELGITGFRFMILYTTPTGETALYAGGATLSPGLIILKSTDGENWIPLNTEIAGTSTRAMVIHEEKLYMAVLLETTTIEPKTLIYVSTDPERKGWELINMNGDPDKNPRGSAVTMLSFNEHLYVGTALPGGFELWRTKGTSPQKDNWKLVVDKGAGDALNEIPLTLGVFKDNIYIGATLFGTRSLNPNITFLPPKGFDLIRVDRNDRWHLVVGGLPITPTEPLTGNRGLSIYPSGFNTITNAYCWQIQAQGNELYLGTFDWSVTIPPFQPLLPDIIQKILPINVNNYLLSSIIYFQAILNINPFFWMFPIEQILGIVLGTFLSNVQMTFGFDLWKSTDGVNWIPVTINGLDNPFNYGARNLFLSSNGKLYLGTANPFRGCEVWVKEP